MTREDIKQELTDLLMQSYDRGVADCQQATVEALEKAVAAAIEIEREACAKVCEEKSMVKGGEVFAARIRARGDK